MIPARHHPGTSRRAPLRWWRWLGLLTILTALLPCPSLGAQTNEPAQVKVSGFGLLGNREMVRLLKNFQKNRADPTVIDESFAEDAALVLLSRVTSEGFLNARLQGRFIMADGSHQSFVWTNALDVILPRDFEAREARFRVRQGVRYYYDTLEIMGAEAISERDARRFFVTGEALLDLRGNRTYSPSALRSSMTALRETLARKGYREATVTATDLVENRADGSVNVTIQIVQGQRTVVRAVTTEVGGPDDPSPLKRQTIHTNATYSPLWQQDFIRQLREDQNAKGFPDAEAQLTTLRRQTNGPVVELDLLARVNTGRFIRLGKVRFEGAKLTHESILQSKVTLENGDPLDRLAAERSRQRLAQLGVFDWVSVRYEDEPGDTRDLVYELKEAKAVSVSLLGGYGSYEMLRGGAEYEHRNVFGLAHSLRMRGIQSFKATSADVVYTIPELFLPRLNLFLRGSGLRRDEVSFTREEYGGAIGVQRRLQAIHTDAALRYDYEFLNASQVDAADPARLGVTEARAAAFVLDLTRDRRDSPLVPRRGLKVSSNVELAAAALGGNVDYQRVMLSGSYHQPLGGGRFLHLGLNHGMTFTAGGETSDLPFNKRFFPGGENSIRGYQQGEASPLDDRGNQLGAETFALANIELEQLLTRTWSVVGFVDALGVAQSRDDYPFDEELLSAGGGIRWRTIIGPIRLEYGHNLNPRPRDPMGTVHVSIGFPF